MFNFVHTSQLLLISMLQVPFWEVYNYSVGQELEDLVPQLRGPVMIQLNSVHTFTFCVLKTHCDIILFPKCLLFHFHSPIIYSQNHVLPSNNYTLVNILILILLYLYSNNYWCSKLRTSCIWKCHHCISKYPATFSVQVIPQNQCKSKGHFGIF
jgi:hypothetical protein